MSCVLVLALIAFKLKLLSALEPATEGPVQKVESQEKGNKIWPKVLLFT